MSNRESQAMCDGTEAALAAMSAVTAHWFRRAFARATEVQERAWPIIARGDHALILAPTGSGKTLAAFLHAIDLVAFRPERGASQKVGVLYVSPLKALAVDVERNLKAPLAGIAALAREQQLPMREVTVGLRTGDTPPRERARMSKAPPDILITTPESLHLMLMSQMSQSLSDVHTVIIDEIHSLCGTKRGAHLAVNLERLEHLRGGAGPALQRIGLSATQRPLSEVATFLGGYMVTVGTTGEQQSTPRPVTIVDAGRTRHLELAVEVPVADMARPTLDTQDAIPSIWPSIYPRLVELIRAHRSTMIFANSRRLAERLAAAVNELAGMELALAHHGSVARDQRVIIEDRLKRGDLPAIVATSSLELGIDMGAVDLVIQIEAPPSVAAGIQRVGRAGHHVGGISKGIIFPKYRGDLLAAAAATAHMESGLVESTRYVRSPLDVLAQLIVSICVGGTIARSELLSLVRGAAPFADLAEPTFDGVLDMLSGRYPSERFRELRARIDWDRAKDVLSASKGARLLAMSNAGTIVERGLYGVFLAFSEPKTRVGELDEEMVFETNPGDVFLLGASSWRVQEITHDAVLVVPAPGEPGRMPFWRGDRLGRPLEFGKAIGRLVRSLGAEDEERAMNRLMGEHRLERGAAINLLAYLRDQDAASEVPTDRRIVIECFVDEVGDWRVAILSHFGGRVHAPWATVIAARLKNELGIEADSMWTDDGMIFRLPDSDEMPDPAWFLIDPESARDLVVTHVSGTALFAAHFRENAARALLLPRRRPGQRVPLWVQRRKSADLLHVAAGYPDFPIVLETFRECLSDTFDLDGLVWVLREIQTGKVRVTQTRTKSASPFAASLMFSYVGDFIYNSDAPLAERRAQALSLDQEQLRLLLGEPELREMLSLEAIAQIERELGWWEDSRPLRDHVDLLRLILELGDLTSAELAERAQRLTELEAHLTELVQQKRLLVLRIAGGERYVATEHCARYRDALGVVLPLGIPSAFLEPVLDPLSEIVQKFAKSRGPFTPQDIVVRYGVGVSAVANVLSRLVGEGILVEGAFLPGGSQREYCDAHVLRRIKRASLARLRAEIEPVEHDVYARFLLAHQFVTQPLRGLDGVLTVVTQMQGVFLPMKVWREHVLPLRVRDFVEHDLDELCAAGELLWQAKGTGLEAKVAFYLTDDFPELAEAVTPVEGGTCSCVREALAQGRALFFPELVSQTGRARPDVVRALRDMVHAGEVTNDTLLPFRRSASADRNSGAQGRTQFRSRRAAAHGAEGRWSLLPPVLPESSPKRAQGFVKQLLDRHGIVTREAVRAAGTSGGFAAVYPVLRLLEESGKVRRGYFIVGLGATQFGGPGTENRLRSFRNFEANGAPLVLSAQDPANPYGAALPWPQLLGSRPTRDRKSWVVLHEGRLFAHLSGDGRRLVVSETAKQKTEANGYGLMVAALAGHFERSGKKAWLIQSIDEQSASESPWVDYFFQVGFERSAKGLLLRRRLIGGPRRQAEGQSVRGL